jgi:AraC-like DNA-binding protein
VDDYREWAAEPALRGVVSCAWTRTTGSPRTYRIVPDGCVDVIFDGVDLQVAGPDTGPVLVRAEAGALVGVRFPPGLAPAVLGLPASELRDQRPRLAEVGPVSARLTEELARALGAGRAGAGSADAGQSRAGVVHRQGKTASGALTSTDRLEPGGAPAEISDLPESSDLLESSDLAGAGGRRPEWAAAVVLQRAVLARFRPERRDPALPAILAGLRAGTGIAELAWDLGIGERALHRRCRAAFGYGPKTAQRVLRFHRAVALARAGHPFARAAAETGYADQAHLARDVRALAGVPLRALLSGTA